MRIFRQLYVWVILAVLAGAAFGHFCPVQAVLYKPLGDGFVKLVRMLIGPIIFCTIATGIGSIGDLRKIGRIGLKALVYFEAVTTLALIIGLVVVNGVRPGANMHASFTSADEKAVSTYTGRHLGVVAFLLNIIPDTFPGALTSGEILQVLLIAVLFGAALARLGDKGRSVADLIDLTGRILMGIVGLIMNLAPLAAFGAISYTVGKSGLGSLWPLARLMGCVYATMLLFVVFVLGGILRYNGLSLWRFVLYLREELLLVLGTSSSESALPGLVLKMERLGCSKPVVGLVLPAGYSFNLDGTCIYLTMASLFIAQATDVRLSLAEQLGIVGLLLLTSKGAAAVTGGGFITLSATLSSTPVPVAGLSLLVGIDRFMSEARALTNLIGNAVATVTIAAWEHEIDLEHAGRILRDRRARAGGLSGAPPPPGASADT